MKQYHLPTQVPYPASRLLEIALNDKKTAGKTVNLIVPEEIGRCRIVTIATDELLDWLLAGGAV